MTTVWDMFVVVDPRDEDEFSETAASARRLRAELLALDVDAADPLADDFVPVGAKGLSAISATMGIKLGAAMLGSVFAKIRDWVGRSGHSVEVTIDGDTIKISGAFPEQQEQAINAWLARHAVEK